jgi:hypothetical protein
MAKGGPSCFRTRSHKLLASRIPVRLASWTRSSRRGRPSLKFAAAKAVVKCQSRAERSSSCIRRTITYGGYRVFVEFDF